jgi:hypothetical protein
MSKLTKRSPFSFSCLMAMGILRSPGAGEGYWMVRVVCRLGALLAACRPTVGRLVCVLVTVRQAAPGPAARRTRG